MASTPRTEPLPSTVAAWLEGETGAVSLLARHVESGREWRRHERHRFPSASLIKLPILAAFWEAAEAGVIAPAERVIVPPSAVVGGTGVLHALGPDLQPTWADLATLMITVSDNTATNAILDRLGMAQIQRWIAAARLGDTRLERRMMDLAAIEAGRQNWTTAADMVDLLSRIHGGTCVSPTASARMRQSLEAQQLQHKLASRLPAAARLANKTGNFADVSHDAGWIIGPAGTLILAVLTQGVGSPGRADLLISRLGAALLDAVGD